MPNITDALDRLRDHDPAVGPSSLSTAERDQIRERIVAVSSTEPSAPTLARPARRRRLGTTVRRGRVIAAFAVVLVGGGVATAAILDQGTTTLVARGLSCISGTNNDAKSDAYNVPQNGNSPMGACAPVIGVSASTLIACADSKAGVIVYEADSDPVDQCKSLGLAPLPSDYTAVITQIHALEGALTADYDHADCISPNQLARDANADLQRLGFTGWQAVIDTRSAAGQEYAGPCGEFPATGASISAADAALDATNHTVMIEIGAPRSTLQLAENVSGQALDASGDQCYTLAGAQQLVSDMLDKAAGHTVPVKFAVTQEPAGSNAMGGSGNGATGDGRQTYYNQGCTIVSGFGTASDGQTFLVLLWNSAGAPAGNTNPQGPLGPAASAFQSDLTKG
jgi:hypothetical protein